MTMDAHITPISSSARVMAGLNLLMSPFLLAFLLMYFFMKKAEQFYHHPSSLGGWQGAWGRSASVAAPGSHAVMRCPLRHLPLP